jgi:hypothetical protein
MATLLPLSTPYFIIVTNFGIDIKRRDLGYVGCHKGVMILALLDSMADYLS